MNITDALVEWSMSASYRDMTPEALGQAKLLLADSLSCMIGGSRTEIGDAILRFLSKSDQGSGVTILGTDLRADPGNAAFANATLANALDFDDTYEQDGKGLSHPSAIFRSKRPPISELSGHPGRVPIIGNAIVP